MIVTLRQRDFSLLWFGGVLSVIGDYFLFIALPFFAYERTGSALATGVMFAAETLPRLLFGSIAGVFVDRWDRKRTMVLADLSRAVILATVVGWFVGTQTLLQKWVPDSYMGRVFGTYETTQALLMLAGIGLAAVLAGPLGAVVVLSVVGVLYVLVGAVASVTLPGDR